ncbi:MAG: SH3 domain-containing protein [Snowella sp.]|nr:SH3 domain-containing protein [Snowella sp.]
MKRFSGLLQFILGFFLGIFALLGATSLLGYLMFSRLAATPPKPTFTEENKAAVKEAPKEKKATEKSEAKAKPEAASSPESKAEAKPSPSPTPSPQAKEEALPQGAYKAKVTWSSGLSLRANPNTDAERVGGVGYNANLIVLETNADGTWAKVRSPESGQEGWVKAGNFKKEE